MKLKAIIIHMLLICTIIPAHADLFRDEFVNCASLDGFVTNADDSTGPAQACLQMTMPDIALSTIPSSGEYTSEQIAEYCMQYESNPDFEQKCIDKYITTEKQKIAKILLIVMVTGVTLCICGFLLFETPPRTLTLLGVKNNMYACVAFTGLASAIGAIITFIILVTVGIL